MSRSSRFANDSRWPRARTVLPFTFCCSPGHLTFALGGKWSLSRKAGEDLPLNIMITTERWPPSPIGPWTLSLVAPRSDHHIIPLLSFWTLWLDIYIPTTFLTFFFFFHDFHTPRFPPPNTLYLNKCVFSPVAFAFHLPNGCTVCLLYIFVWVCVIITI